MNKIVILFFVTIPILAYSQTYRAVDVFDGPQIYWLDNYLKPNVSGSNSTRKVVPVRLPQNTVKWFYSISTTRNMADIEQTKNVFNLFAQLSRLIDNTGISAIVISQIGRPPISNPIDVYLLSSYRDAETFMSKYSNLGSGFNYQAIDSRERFVQGRAEVISNNHMKGMQYIGIRNTDASYGLAVYVQVVAIVEEPEQQTSYSSYNNRYKPQATWSRLMN